MYKSKVMKHLIIAILACLPLMGMAQNTWELPKEENKQAEPKKKALFEKNKKNEDPKYLEGAVPVVDGKVVFTLDRNVPGMSADEIYNKLYVLLDSMTKAENQSEMSHIAVVNKAEHTIAARFREWLVFQNTFLALDRTVFNYVIIANATDGHVKVTMERLNYQYEMSRTESGGGLEVKAEEWITDDNALNKKKTKLTKGSANFRRKTIDRKDYIFHEVCSTLGIPYNNGSK